MDQPAVTADEDLPEGLTPIPLLHLITGFWAAQTLAAAVRLDLFGLIERAGRLTRTQAAEALAIQDRPADLLLAACAALGLLEKEGDAYVNSALSRAFLIQGRPYYFGGFVRYLDHREYPAWHKLPTALHTNRPTTWDPDRQSGLFDAEDPVMVSLFWEAMHSMSTFTGRALARALPELAHREAVMDVGGGSGAIPMELCRAYPALRASVYDLPFVCGIAAQKIEHAGLGQRIGTIKGDFIADAELPSGHDTLILSQILHDWDEGTDRAILRKCFDALPPDGVIIIAEELLNEERTGPPRAALMGLNMLIETLGGKNYAAGEYLAWLAEAGFTQSKVVPFESVGANGIIVARKP
jgi:hypothetical protein